MLEIKRLSTHFHLPQGTVKAVDGLDLRVAQGETVALVGESGSGKSTAALSISRLIREPGRIVSGEIIFKGRDLRKLKEAEMRKVRGREIAHVFQEPAAALNPILTIGDQIAETVRTHTETTTRNQAFEMAAETLAAVHMPQPRLQLGAYPHELSGGMCQRALIAMALCCNPALLIADEPTAALDLTVRAELLGLLRALKAERGLSLLLITHDFGVAAGLADRIAVMYGGKIAEEAPTEVLFQTPKHPYTRALLDVLPKWTGQDVSAGRRRLRTIAGSPPSLLNPPERCLFAPRCPDAMDLCTERIPAFQALAEGHGVRCFKYGTLCEDRHGRGDR